MGDCLGVADVSGGQLCFLRSCEWSLTGGVDVVGVVGVIGAIQS